MLNRVSLLASVLAALSLAPTTSSAQDDRTLERARVAFELGRQAYERGSFDVALTHFEEAHRLTGNPDILYNIGTVADRLRRDEVALGAYRGYLRQRPDTEDRAQIEARVAVLAEQVAVHERERDEATAREEEQRVLREQLASRGEPGTVTTVAADPGPVPWVVAAAGGALLVTGIALVIVAELDAACVRMPSGCVEDATMPRWSEVSGGFDRIPILQGVGGALIGVGAAAAAAGVVWGIVGAGGGGASVEVAVGPTSLTARGRF